MPDDADPTGTVVGINRGDGHPKTLRVGPDGEFRFTRLTPGLWQVEKRDEEIWSQTISIRTSQAAVEKEMEWNCRVREGETTRFDLHLHPEGAFGLRGTAILDGKPASGWTAWMCPPDSDFFDNQGKWPTATTNPRGEFSLSVSEPGTYKVVLKYVDLGDERIFAEDVYIGGPSEPWSLDASTGTLIVEGMKPLTGEEQLPELVYVREGEVQFWCLVLPDETGRACLTGVPEGPGKLLRPSMKSMNPADWDLAAEVTISAGKETRYRMP
jgi:hypothetical protein